MPIPQIGPVGAGLLEDFGDVSAEVVHVIAERHNRDDLLDLVVDLVPAVISEPLTMVLFEMVAAG
jgi:hypothetical protein